MRSINIGSIIQCDTDRDYLVNGESVGAEVYNSVQEGHTYICEGSKCVEEDNA